jgi:L-iditol 2-dehydrogenase
MLIVMFLMDAGYNNIFVIGNKQSQETMAESLGISIDHYIDCKKDDASALFNGNTGGAELFFECVGTIESISCAIDSSAPTGRVVLVGNPHSDILLDRNVYWKILRNQLKVTGTWNSTFNGRQDDDWHYVIDRLKSHSISPAVLITHRLKLEELDNGLNIMHYKTENYCKIMVIL